MFCYIFRLSFKQPYSKIRCEGNNCAIVSRSGYIWIWSGARDQESTNHSAQFVEWKSSYITINNYSPKWRLISTSVTDTEENNCFSIYHTSWITSGPKSNFICENEPTKAILFSLGCSEVNSAWLITSELANQRTRKVQSTCVVYTNNAYWLKKNEQ